MSNPLLPVNVDISAKAELKGELSTPALDAAVHSLVDALSPFTQGMGLIGDHIRAHRYDVAIRITKRARELAEQRALPITPPPLKFTVPFIEKASTETSDADLVEMWARLLCRCK
jgi:hypothetical protein